MLSLGFVPTPQPSTSDGVPRFDDGNQVVTTGEPKLVEICYELRLIPPWFHLNKYLRRKHYEQMESITGDTGSGIRDEQQGTINIQEDQPGF